MAAERDRTWYKVVSIIIGALLMSLSLGPACTHVGDGMKATDSWLSVGTSGIITEFQRIPGEPVALLLAPIAAALVVVMFACPSTTARAQGGTGISAFFLVILGYEMIRFSLFGPEFSPAFNTYLMLILVVAQLALSVTVLFLQKRSAAADARS